MTPFALLDVLFPTARPTGAARPPSRLRPPQRGRDGGPLDPDAAPGPRASGGTPACPPGRAGCREVALLAARCCLAAGETPAAVLEAARRHRQFLLPDVALCRDDGVPVLSARLAALGSRSDPGRLGSTVESGRALAALERVLQALTDEAPDALAAAPTAVIVGLTDPFERMEHDAASALVRARWGDRTAVRVLAADFGALWQAALASVAQSPGRTTLLAAAHSDLGPQAIRRMAAAGELHAHSNPDGAIPGEGAVALLLNAIAGSSPPGAGAPVQLLIPLDWLAAGEAGTDVAAAAAQVQPGPGTGRVGADPGRAGAPTASRAADAGPAGAPTASPAADAGPAGAPTASRAADAGPAGAPTASRAADPGPAGAPTASPAADAIERALSGTGVVTAELAGWFCDLQPQTVEAGALLTSAIDGGLAADPAAFALSRCGTLGAAGALAVVALAATHARAVGKPVLALAAGAGMARAIIARPAATSARP